MLEKEFNCSSEIWSDKTLPAQEQNASIFFKKCKKLYTLYTDHCNIQYINLLSSV